MLFEKLFAEEELKLYFQKLCVSFKLCCGIETNRKSRVATSTS
jgi:hypothetical protein